jgi:hypothetical protein
MLDIVGRFVLHMVVGTLLFGAVAGFAIAIWTGTRWLENLGVPFYIYWATEGVAVLFFALDILCLVIFVIAETLKLLRLIWLHAWR